jgi:hypothetical protein
VVYIREVQRHQREPITRNTSSKRIPHLISFGFQKNYVLIMKAKTVIESGYQYWRLVQIELNKVHPHIPVLDDLLIAVQIP